MDEQVAFIDAIRDAPDDDAHRLVFADWMEDHGQAEQAAFIRAHVTLTHFHACGEDPFERTGQLNVMALRPAVRDGLLAAFAPLRGAVELAAKRRQPLHEVLNREYQFLAHRGLVELISVGNQHGISTLAARAEVLRQAPVRFVALHHQPWWLPGDERPAMDGISEYGLEALLASDAINYLEAIDLRRIYLGDRQVAVIIRHAKPLRRVRLRLYIRGGPTQPTAYIRRLTEAFGPQLIALPPITDAFDDGSIPF